MRWILSKLLGVLSLAGGVFTILAVVLRLKEKQVRTEIERDEAEDYIDTRKDMDDAVSHDRDLPWHERLRKARERQ